MFFGRAKPRRNDWPARIAAGSRAYMSHANQSWNCAKREQHIGGTGTAGTTRMEEEPKGVEH